MSRIISLFLEYSDFLKNFAIGCLMLTVFPVETGECAPSPETVNAIREDANAGDPEAMYLMGLLYEKGEVVPKNYETAASYYRRAAEKGHAEAQISLAICYENEIGVPKDMRQAVYWYRKAAWQGNAYAQASLGLCYEYGQGVEKDEIQAVKWYKEAAEGGDSYGQYWLGRCYLNGVGVPKNMTQAIYWLRKAADQGNKRAQEALDAVEGSVQPPPPPDGKKGKGKDSSKGEKKQKKGGKMKHSPGCPNSDAPATVSNSTCPVCKNGQAHIPASATVDYTCDSKGRTALYFAVMQGDEKRADKLLRQGANPYAATNKGDTPYDLAKKKGGNIWFLFRNL